MLYLPLSTRKLGSIALRPQFGAVVLWAALLVVLALASALLSARRVLRIAPVTATTGAGVGAPERRKGAGVIFALTELRRRPQRFVTAGIILTLISVLLLFLGGLLDGLVAGRPTPSPSSRPT